jgi:hypothetical protein
MERVQVQATAAATAAEETMALYDAFWFRRCVLLPSPPLAVDEEQPPAAISPSGSPTPGPRHRRTRSDEATAFQHQGLEPLRIPNNHRARLETILSGKDGTVAAAPQPRRPEARWRPARRRRRGRSMSELEFEELKGLQDLGFTFPDAEVDAELASIVPGLCRKRSQTPPRGAEGEEAPVVEPRRPYLSEAWGDDEEQVRAMLRNWRIPAAGDGADMKHHLLVWAHTVASAVR